MSIISDNLLGSLSIEDASILFISDENTLDLIDETNASPNDDHNNMPTGSINHDPDAISQDQPLILISPLPTGYVCLQPLNSDDNEQGGDQINSTTRDHLLNRLTDENGHSSMERISAHQSMILNQEFNHDDVEHETNSSLEFQNNNYSYITEALDESLEFLYNENLF